MHTRGGIAAYLMRVQEIFLGSPENDTLEKAAGEWAASYLGTRSSAFKFLGKLLFKNQLRCTFLDLRFAQFSPGQDWTEFLRNLIALCLAAELRHDEDLAQEEVRRARW